MKQQYDYIIAGAGCAGLSLLVRMLKSGKFSDKEILLIDKEPKNNNDRTWCFWEEGDGFFEEIVYRKWEKIWFYAKDFPRGFNILPYRYKMIRGADFYDYCFSIIRQYANVEIVWLPITDLGSSTDEAWIVCGNEKIQARYIFNSILFEKPTLRKTEHFILQHFKGWVIETGKDCFNSDEAVLMDFRVSQQLGTTFVYLMPLSSTSALVEYTLFSDHLLSDHEYDKGLKNYIRQILQIEDFTITEEEFGIIPMTNHRFPRVEGKIINIGTAGGYTKASTGYTFNPIQKATAQMVERWINSGDPSLVTVNNKRFQFYDDVFLDVLAKKRIDGIDIFTALFMKNKIQHIFKFLDNESTWQQEIGILASLPIWPFLKSAFKQI